MMKRLFLLGFLQMVICNFISAQVLCVQCFEQNDSISSFVNNRIINGSFENTTCTPGWFEDCFCPNASSYNCDIENWICTDGGTSTYTSIFDGGLSTVPEGTKAAYFGNGNSLPCSTTFNDTFCLTVNSCQATNVPNDYPTSLPGYGEASGVSLEQTVGGLTIGDTYVLEFWAGGESFGGLLTEKGLFAVNVGFGRIMLRCTPTSMSSPRPGTRYVVQFMATATSHTIKFTNWGHACDICTELVLDDVRLYSLDELDASVAKCITKTTETKEESSFTLYPNPFTSELTILTDWLGTTEFMMFNSVSGLVIHRQFQEMISLNTTDYSAGIYYYEARDNKGHYTSGTIIKEK